MVRRILSSACFDVYEATGTLIDVMLYLPFQASADTGGLLLTSDTAAGGTFMNSGRW